MRVSIGKILLYYGFTPIKDPEAVMLWQRDLCESLGLKGRILISEHGINGTVGGDMEACKKYVRKTKEYPGFRKISFKWSDGDAEDFPRLSVKVRDEIVAFGAPGELKVDENGVIGGGVHLKPEEVNELVEKHGDEVRSEACKKYVRKTKEYPGFRKISFKWSDGDAEDFPRLSVKVRDEIVAFGAPGELKVDENGVIGGGVHLKPEEVNELVEKHGDEV